MKKTLSILLALLLLSGVCAGCAASPAGEAVITSPAELNDSRYTVGYSVGTASAADAEAYYTQAELALYTDGTDGYVAVENGKLDGFVFSRVNMEYAIASGGLHNVHLLDESIGRKTEVVVGVSRLSEIPGLRERLNAFIRTIHADGSFDEIYERWIVRGEKEMPEIPEPKDPDFTIRIGTCGEIEPFAYYINDTLAGLDIELALRFAASINAKVEFFAALFTPLIAAAESGSIDCIFANLNATPERAEVMDFSDPIYTLDTAVMVRGEDPDGEGTRGSFFESMRESFEKTFIREARWRMILRGLGVTVFISVLSAVFGTALGFGICLLRRRGGIPFGVTTVYIRIMQGMPLLVLLMVLYYLVFPQAGMSGEWVAIIGFSLHFAAYVSEIMRSGIESIDKGQTEAALALGFTKQQAFLRFVFPKAARHFLPVYRGEFISMIKMTSVVGYIAVQDLTKISDIIRSRTYEAFFPLISTALIYFLLSALLSALLRRIELRLEPDRTNRRVKGVKLS